jgi:radical SAM superfamily enzyme YgiQ (UPF0313 family)
MRDIQNPHAVIFTGSPVGALPLGAYSVRTMAEDHGFRVQVVDFCWSLTSERLADVCKTLIGPDTKVVGLSGNWVDVKWQMDGHSIGKFIVENYPNVILVEGSQKHYKTCHYAKWWFRGFSEQSFVLFLYHVYEGQAQPRFTIDGYGTRIVHSDNDYPVPPEHMHTNWKPSDWIRKQDALPIEIGRGCIFNCSFCHHPFLGKKKGEYTRNVDSLTAEFKRNHELFGTTRYQFIDDTFNDSIEKIQLVLDARNRLGIDLEFICFLRAEMLVTQPQTMDMLVELGLRSAHVGIESLNENGRKAAGKGMATGRILDSIAKLRERSKNRISLWATFIAGLPGDTVDSVLKQAEWCKEHRDTHFQAWWHYGLNLDQNAAHPSKMERDPAAYGYELRGNIWSSKEMTSSGAVDIANAINRNLHRPYMRASGYPLAYCWGTGMTDEEINDTPYLDINFEQKLKAQADEYFKQLL